MQKGGGLHVDLIPGTFRPSINKENDYLIDRAAQKARATYSGVQGIAMQDASLQESMGPIQDRIRENLVLTDKAIVMARSRLSKAALDLEKGKKPSGIDPETQAIRSASFVLPRNVPFSEAPGDPMRVKPGIPHTSI